MSALWVAFLMPFVLLFLLSVTGRARFPGAYNATAITRGRILLFFAGGAILAIWCLARLPALMDDNTAYFSDPSCTSGTSFEAPRASDPCRTETVGIASTRIHRGGRSGTHYYLTLERANGARTEVEVNIAGGIPAWRAATASPGLAAHLQLFRDRPVLLATDQGVIRTQAFPTDVMRTYQFLLAFGAGMALAAILDAIYSWQSLI